MKKSISAAVLLLFLFALSGAFNVSGQEKSPEKKDVALKEVKPFSYCALYHKGPFTDIEKVIGKLMQSMQNQSIFPQGPMIGIYYNSPDEVKPEDLEWEMGFPVTDQIPVQKPLEKKQWEFTQVAFATHTGPYEETGQTIIKIFEWMQDNNLKSAGPVLEKYLTAPGPNTKPEDIKTEIWIPCKKIEE